MEMKNGQHPEGCQCDMCKGAGKCGSMCGCGHKNPQVFVFHVLRWLFAIAILSIVFSVGVQIGKISNFLEQGGGWGHNQMYYSGQPMMYTTSSGYGMMRGQTVTMPVGTTVPAQGATVR